MKKSRVFGYQQKGKGVQRSKMPWFFSETISLDYKKVFNIKCLKTKKNAFLSKEDRPGCLRVASEY